MFVAYEVHMLLVAWKIDAKVQKK